MSFGNPGWLPAGCLACVVLVWLWRHHDARQRRALARFVSPHLRAQLTRSLSPVARRTRRGLYLAAVALLFVALAGPLIGYRWEQISRRGNEIVFAIDTSRSMSTPDVKPDRLTRAKLAIDDFVQRLDGDAVGIVAFAGTAFLVCPITLDYGAFHQSLSAIDTHTIPHGGTNIASAIRDAQEALRRRPGSDKILILVTDGEDLEGGALDAARQAARASGLRIYTVGVGTAAGDLIPIAPAEGSGFVRDEAGALVRSKLDEVTLKAIAAATGGIYVPLGAQGEGLETVFRSIFGSTAKHDLASRQQRIYIERYQWPLAASLAMLLASLCIGTRRRGAAARPARPARADVTVLASLTVFAGLLGLALGSMSPLRAASAVPDAAVGPTHPVQEFNRGTAAYRAGDYPRAVQAFQRAITESPSSGAQRLHDQQDAYYNLGNALFRLGQQTEKTAPQQTIQKWTDAVKAYDTALQLRADDADSRYNRDLVKRKLEALQPKPDPKQDSSRDPRGGGAGPPDSSRSNPPSSQPPSPAQQPPAQPPSPAQAPPAQQPPPTQPPASPPPPANPPPARPSAPSPQGQPPTGPPPPSPAQPPPMPQPPAQAPPPSSQTSPTPTADRRAPGQMSAEEARELLDSVKNEERHGLPVPRPVRGAEEPPDKPFKNW